MRDGYVIWGTPTLLNAFAEECAFPLNSSISLNYPSLEVGFDNDGFRFYGSYGNRTEHQHFHLPQNWGKAVIAIKNQYIEFTSQSISTDNKVSTGIVNEAIDINTLEHGDFVVVLPEDNHYYNCEHNDKDEAIPQMFLRLGSLKGRVDLLFSDNSTNSYQKVRKATPEEIERYYKIPEKVKGFELAEEYEESIGEGTIGYGCKQFTKKDINTLINAIEIADKINDFATFILKKEGVMVGDTLFNISMLSALKLKIKQ